MSKNYFRIGHWLLVASLFFAIGGHWTVLQTVAWGQMIVDFSQRDDFRQAIEKTFDGDHPCTLCLQITDSLKKEKKSGEFSLIKKIELFRETTPEFVVARSEFWLFPVEKFRAITRSPEPAVLPPRWS